MSFLRLLCLLATLILAIEGQRQGLQRRVTKRVSCSNAEKAAAGDTVTIHYTGRLASNNKQFDSSLGGEPIKFELGKNIVIAGWEQGLLGTCPGESLELIIPPELGYGENGDPYTVPGAGDGVIPPNAKLIFTLTLEDLQKKRSRSLQQQAKKKDLEITTTKSATCSRSKTVRKNDRITLHYKMSLEDGTLLDSSYDRNQPLEMTVGEVGIVGWDKGVQGACPGEIRIVTIPPHLGYGDKGIEGVIPPNATIVLEMEVLTVQDRVLSFLDQISSGSFGRKK